ncbi:MAG: hypothetical protein V7459_13545 [Oceanicoccus sp.]
METQKFEHEWRLLQNQFDSYEKHSLYIKLLSIIAVLVVEITGTINISFVLVLVVLWLQDAIWKTFQSRLEQRLLQVEKYILERSEASAFQFNSEYQRTRLYGVSLIGEYLRQSVRPTVAFPHIMLILVLLAQYSL